MHVFRVSGEKKDTGQKRVVSLLRGYPSDLRLYETRGFIKRIGMVTLQTLSMNHLSF
jgi:hypothetical protein